MGSRGDRKTWGNPLPSIVYRGGLITQPKPAISLSYVGWNKQKKNSLGAQVISDLWSNGDSLVRAGCRYRRRSQERNVPVHSDLCNVMGEVLQAKGRGDGILCCDGAIYLFTFGSRSSLVVSFIHPSSSPTLHSDGNQMALVDYGSSSDDEEGHASQKRATPPSKKFVLYRVLTSPNAYRTDMSLGQRNCPACL